MSWTALAAGLLSGIIGAMGLGGGAVLIIYLSVFTDMPQLKSQGIACRMAQSCDGAVVDE